MCDCGVAPIDHGTSPGLRHQGTGAYARKKNGSPKFEIVFNAKNPNTLLNLGKPDASFDAAAWFELCKKDFKGTGEKYRGKVIELTGVVANLGEEFDNLSFNLRVDPKGGFERVRCMSADPRPWLKVAPRNPK